MPRFYTGHPVIPPRQIEAKVRQAERSVVTGSSACADDDGLEHEIRRQARA